jgi:hypothetical protein
MRMRMEEQRALPDVALMTRRKQVGVAVEWQVAPGGGRLTIVLRQTMEIRHHIVPPSHTHRPHTRPLIPWCRCPVVPLSSWPLVLVLLALPGPR